MNNRKKITTIILVALLVLALAVPAFAAMASKNITVYTGANLYFNDKAFYPTDANGNAVDAFIYNGTTYLPVRAICNLLDVDIAWEGATQSVFVGKHSSSTPACYLDEMDYFTNTKDGLYKVTSSSRIKDNLGNQHEHALAAHSIGSSQTYVLNGQYSELSGTYYLEYGNRSNSGTYTFTVYGDGVKLYSSSVSGGTYPIDFAIDLTGVLELKLEFSTFVGTIGDVALWR